MSKFHPQNLRKLFFSFTPELKSPASVLIPSRLNINIIGWAHTSEFNTREKAAETMNQYASWGLKGAKIDFFDHNTLSENPREWRDYEDTQQSLQMRDLFLQNLI